MACSQTIHSRTNRRVTFDRCFIAIDLQQWTSFATPARGGNVRSFANTCQHFRWNSSVKRDAENLRCSLKGASLERRELARYIRRAMAKEEQIITEGTVTQVLPGTMFRVDLPGQRNVLAHFSGKKAKPFIRIGPRRQGFGGTFAIRSDKGAYH